VSFASQCARLRRDYGRPDLDAVSAVIAADFMNGGAPRHARVFDRKGMELAAYTLEEGESAGAFRERARSAAQGLAGAARIVLGGVGPLGAPTSVTGLPRGAVSLPDVPLHESQRQAVRLIEANRRVCLVAGRRWGKSTVVCTLAVDAAISSRSVAIYAPTYRLMRPLLDAVALALSHLPGVKINRADNEIRLAQGGAVDFWSIDVTQRAGRGRAYDLVLVDESAHDENDYLASMLEATIAPTTPRPPRQDRLGEHAQRTAGRVLAMRGQRREGVRSPSRADERESASAGRRDRLSALDDESRGRQPRIGRGVPRRERRIDLPVALITTARRILTRAGRATMSG
jgi:hypothetical protein